MEPFKNLYNERFYLTLSIHLKACLPDFDEQEFMALMLCDNFEALELKRAHESYQSSNASVYAN